MKRTVITTVMLFAIVSYNFAQKAFEQHNKIVSLGVGFGSPYWANYFKSALPVNPTLTIERGIYENISVGTTFAYSRSKYNYYGLSYIYNALYLGGRGSYHFDISKEDIDLYVGAGLGYAIVIASVKGDGPSTVYGGGTSGIGYSVFGGGRYYFTKKTAVYAELGYSSFSVLNAGITLKL